MALQQLVCCFTVLIILLCQGCRSQQFTCGRAGRNNRIIGGQGAADGSWPWFAVVNNNFGGTLITNEWVLTAALVGLYEFGDQSVYLGRHNRSGSNPNEVRRTAVNITCHPDYNFETNENDICLLKLSAPVTLTDYIQPICLDSENSTFNNITSGWTIGFGFTNTNPNQVPDILQEVNLPIVGTSECEQSIQRPEWDSAIKNGICAGAEGKSPCLRDQGGPLMTKENSVWVQTGVLSLPACRTDTPYSVYTRVSKYQKWISSIVTWAPPGTDSNPTSSSLSPTTAPTTSLTTLPPTDPTSLPPTDPTTFPTTAPTSLPPTDPTTFPTTAPTTLSLTTPTTDPTTAPTTSLTSLPPTDPTTLPTTAPTTAPTSLPPTAPTTLPLTAPTTVPTPLICDSLFCAGENLIHFTHFSSLCALVALLHIFVGIGAT